MKRRAIFVALMINVVLGLSSAQAAIQMEATITADNVVEAFYKNGGTLTSVWPDPPLNHANWRQADTVPFSVGHAGEHTLYFLARQDGGFSKRNPAAFLADIKLDGKILASTSQDWQWAYASNTSSPAEVTSWAAVTTHGTNASSDPNVWSHVAGISNSAQWIWGGPNFNDPDPVPQQWLKVTVDAVPEPAAFAVWSLLAAASIGLTTWRRRK